jgi:hypothetical protein
VERTGKTGPPFTTTLGVEIEVALLGSSTVSHEKPFRTFADFYPFYLSEHANRISRRLHFVGTSIAVALLIAALVTQLWWLVAAALIQGYALAWVGHFFFEHNRPATFRYPRFSFMGDWRLWWEILTGKVRL